MKQSSYFTELVQRQKRMKKVFLNSVCCKCVCVDDLKWKDDVGDVMCDKCYENMKRIKNEFRNSLYGKQKKNSK